MSFGQYPIKTGSGSGGAGTVTSVALSDGSSVPIYTISGSPVTVAGTLTFTLATQAKNLVFSGPSSGADAQPGFRTLVAADLPTGNLTDAGTDGITVTSGTGAVIGSGTSIAQHVADATHNGYLSSADWVTFNAKQAALTIGNLTDVGTDGITVTGGTGAVIGSGTSIAQHVADTTHNGYLSSTDWNTFNGKGAGSVTSVALSVPATSIFGVTGSPVTTSGTLGLTTTGTSGGIPYFSSTSQISSSALLTANQLILGGGAGATPATLAAGSQFQVLVMGASNPGYGQVNLAQSAAVTGALPIGNGGTGQTAKAAAFDALSPMTTGGDIIYGGASGTGTRLANGTAGQRLVSAGTTVAPVWQFNGGTVQAKSGTYIVLTSDGLVTGDATSAGFTLTLPAASNAGKILYFKKIDSSANAVTIARAGSDTIDGATSITLTVQYESVILIADGGTAWYIF